MGGKIPQRIGSEHPNIAPYGDVFRTLDDKEVVLVYGTKKKWLALCRVLKLEALVYDEKFSTNAAHVKNRVELYTHLNRQMDIYKRDELLQLFKDAQIPIGAIKNMAEVFYHTTAKSFILEGNNNQNIKSKSVKTVAFKIS